jgi:hypothetical protein
VIGAKHDELKEGWREIMTPVLISTKIKNVDEQAGIGVDARTMEWRTHRRMSVMCSMFGFAITDDSGCRYSWG